MNRAVAFLFAVVAGSSHAEPSFAGLWFSCDAGAAEYTVVNVQPQDRSGLYEALLESSYNGGVYSAELRGMEHEGRLRLRGCQAYRGEESVPCVQINVELGAPGGEFERIARERFDSLAAQCKGAKEHANQ